MPNAVLAAVVLLIGLRLVDIAGMQGIARVRTGEFVVAALTAATVVIVGIEQAIILAIVLSIIEHLSHAYKPHDTTLAVDAGGPARVDAGQHRHRHPGRARASSSTASAPASTTPTRPASRRRSCQILEEADPKVEWFCLSARVDAATSTTRAPAPCARWPSEVKKHGAKFVVCEVEPGVADVPAKYGLQPEIDGDLHVHRGRHRGVRQAGRGVVGRGHG